MIYLKSSWNIYVSDAASDLIIWNADEKRGDDGGNNILNIVITDQVGVVRSVFTSVYQLKVAVVVCEILIVDAGKFSIFRLCSLSVSEFFTQLSAQ